MMNIMGITLRRYIQQRIDKSFVFMSQLENKTIFPSPSPSLSGII